MNRFKRWTSITQIQRMKKTFSICAFILLVNICFGQLKIPVKDLFYGINLTAPRAAIYNQLTADKRFLQKGSVVTDSLSPFYNGEFHGLAFDQGLVKERADSIKVSLNWLVFSNKVKDGTYESINNLIFLSKYYYASHDNAKKEYEHIVDLIHRKNSDTSHQLKYNFYPIPVSITRFNFHKPDYEIEVELYKIDPTHSELRLSFIRKE